MVPGAGPLSRLTLDKSTLARKRGDLKLYERFLPSLELKRRQLLATERQARRAMAALEAELAEAHRAAEPILPFLGWEPLSLEGLVRVETVQVGRENVVGVHLPVLERLEVVRTPYSFFGRPHWVDPLVDVLERLARLTVEHDVALERARRLKKGLDTITQRVNLFEKVLIPRTKDDIRTIQLYLADAERAAVVRSKLAKKMREREAGL